MNVVCEGCRKSYLYAEDPSERPYSDCPGCHTLNKVGTRPPLNIGMTEAFTDSDKWNPWVPHLGPMDPPRLAEWKAKGWIRTNPKTGAPECYCPTRKDYTQRVKECGLTTDWLGQGDRSKRRESREEWESRKTSGKVYFT